MFPNKSWWTLKGVEGNHLVKGNIKVHNWEVRNMPNQKQKKFGNEVDITVFTIRINFDYNLIMYHTYLSTCGLMSPIDDNDLFKPKFLPTNATTSCQ
jgi:hypothetical protein